VDDFLGLFCSKGIAYCRIKSVPCGRGDGLLISNYKAKLKRLWIFEILWISFCPSGSSWMKCDMKKCRGLKIQGNELFDEKCGAI